MLLIKTKSALTIAENAFFNWIIANAATVAIAGATIFGVLITTFNKIFQVYLRKKTTENRCMTVRHWIKIIFWLIFYYFVYYLWPMEGVAG